MKIYSTILTYNPTASSQATSYPATNLYTEQVRKPWRSTAVTAQWVKFDLLFSSDHKGLLLQDVNFSAFTVQTSVDDVTYSTAVGYTAYADTAGRYKALAQLSGTFRYVRVNIGAQTPIDGASYFSVGAAYMFRMVTSSTINPVYGLGVNVSYPQSRVDLPNGRTITTNLGSQYTELTGQWDSDYSQDSAATIRSALTGIIGIDMEMSTALWMVWPCRNFDGKIDRNIQDFSIWPTSFTFKEVV